MQRILDLFVAGQKADIVNRAPQHGGGRQPLSTAIAGQRFKPMVGRHIVGLSRVTEQSGGRGEHHKEVQLQLTGELVQVLRALGLGFQHALQLLGVEITDQAVIDDGGRVHQAP